MKSRLSKVVLGFIVIGLSISVSSVFGSLLNYETIDISSNITKSWDTTKDVSVNDIPFTLFWDTNNDAPAGIWVSSYAQTNPARVYIPIGGVAPLKYTY